MSQKIKQYELKDNINYIKIHGLQRTATNYIAYLLNNNLKDTEVLVNIGGWKHGHYCAPWTLGEEVHVVTVVKNPYSWLVSLYNYLKPQMPFVHFLKRPLVVGEKSGSPYLLRSSNPVEHWNNMNYHWMSIQINYKKLFIVSYENVLQNTDLALKNISNYFELSLQENKDNPKNRMEASNEKQHISEDAFDVSYYTNRKYLDYFNNETFSFVNQHIEPMIMQQLGYRWEGK